MSQPFFSLLQVYAVFVEGSRLAFKEEKAIKTVNELGNTRNKRDDTKALVGQLETKLGEA